MIQLLALLFLIILITVYIQNPFAKIFFIIALLLFFALQAVSYFFLTKPFNTAVINHISLDTIINTFDSFKWLWLTLFLSLTALGIGIFLLTWTKPCFALKRNKWMHLLLFLIVVTVLCLPGGVASSILDVSRDVKASMAPAKSLEQALADLVLDYNDYTTPARLKVAGGNKKNVVIISAESLERYFMDRKELTPRLNQLAGSWSYYPQFANLSGTRSTITSLHGWNCGWPAMLATPGFSYFLHAMPENMVTLPMVLSKAGYDSYFVTSMPFLKIAGTDRMLLKMKYKTLWGDKQDFSREPLRGAFGFFDKDIFDLAKEKYDELQAQGHPFMLSIATVDTHFPLTAHDPRMDEVPLGSSSQHWERLIQWTDYLIVDFITYIESKYGLENTIIMVIPDHVRLDGELRSVLLEDPNSRKLFLLTNSSPEEIGFDTESPISHLTIPRMVLNATEISANISTLPEMLGTTGGDTESTERWLEANRAGLISLMDVFWKQEEQELRIKREKEAVRFDYCTNGNNGEIKCKTFRSAIPAGSELIYLNLEGSIATQSDLRPLLYSPIDAFKEATRREDGVCTLLVKVHDGEISAFFYSSPYPVPIKAYFAEDNDELIINLAEDFFPMQAEGVELSRDSLKKKNESAPIFSNIPFLSSKHQKVIYQLTSVSQDALRKGYTTSVLETNSFNRYGLEPGINLIWNDGNILYYQSFATSEKEADVRNFLRTAEHVLRRNDFWALAVHRDGAQKIEPYRERIRDLGLPVLAQLEQGEPYIAIKTVEGAVEEIRGNSFSLPQPWLKASFYIGLYDSPPLLLKKEYLSWLRSKEAKNALSASAESSQFSREGARWDGSTPTFSLISSLNKDHKSGVCFASDSKFIEIPRGITLIQSKEIGLVYQNFKPDQSEDQAESFAQELEKVVNGGSFWAVAVNDKLTAHMEGIRDRLAKLGLPVLARLNADVPYLAYVWDDGEIYECTGDTSSTVLRSEIALQPGMLSILYAVKPEIANKVKQYNASPQPPFFRGPKAASYTHDQNAFIAHGGWQIGTIIVPNCLESVKAAIDNGFKFIELDLIKTSDGHVVAAHDWAMFNQYTGHYELKDEAPTLEEFSSRRLAGKYTPLAFADVVEIFSKNPNLILVTDKIKDYKFLSENFPFPDRLIVEVFSVPDFFKALEVGIKYPAFCIDSESKLIQALAYDFKLVTSSGSVMRDYAWIYAQMHKRDVTIMTYSYALPSHEADSKDFFDTHMGKAMSLFYTDTWSPKLGGPYISND